MKNLNKIAKEVRNARHGENRPWIFNKDGSISKKVALVDALKIIEELKPYEINYDEELVEMIEEEGDFDNTYNHGANISNDIRFAIWKNYAVIRFHLFGDVRGNYSDEAIIKFNNVNKFWEGFWDLESINSFYTLKVGKEKFRCEICALNDTMEIYRESTMDYLCTTSENEKENIITDIKKALEEEE